MDKKLDITDIQPFITTILGFESCIVCEVGDHVSTEVYKLLQDNKVYYLRIAGEGEDIASEALAHRLLLEKGVKVPRIVAYGDNNNAIKRSYLVTSEIAGLPYQKDPAANSKVVFDAGKQLALINTIPTTNFGWIDRTVTNPKEFVGCYHTYTEFALNPRRIKSMVDDLLNLEIISKSLATKYLKYIENRKDSFDPGEPCLAHGDFDSSHIFSKDSKYQGIIDFGDIRCTSIYHDLAHFYVYEKDDFQTLFEGYLTVTDIGLNCIDKIRFEAMLFEFGRLWWMVKNIPDHVGNNHPILNFLKSVLS